MKKVFSLICLFIFIFFGVVNTVFAADNGKEVLSIDNVKTRLKELLKANKKVSINDVVFENNQLIIKTKSGTDFIFNYNSEEYKFSYEGNGILVDPTANEYLRYMRSLFNAVMAEHGFTSKQISEVRNRSAGTSASGQKVYNIEGLFYYEGAEYIDSDTGKNYANLNYSISLASSLKKSAEDILNNDQTGDSENGDGSGDSGSSDGETDDSGNSDKTENDDELDDFDNNDEEDDSENDDNTGDLENGDGSDESGNSGGETDDSGNSGGESGDSDNTGTGTGTGEKPEDNVDTSDISVGNLLLIGGCLLLIAGYGAKKLKKIK